jgi:hypothetical protein
LRAAVGSTLAVFCDMRERMPCLHIFRKYSVANKVFCFKRDENAQLVHNGVKILRLEACRIVIFDNLKKQELCTAISFFLIRERRGKDLYDGSKIPNYSD